MGEHRAASDHVHATMRIALLGVVVLLQFGLSLRPLLEQEYRHRWLSSSAFVALLCVTAACSAWVPRRRPVPAVVVTMGTVVVLAASSCAAAAVPPGGHFRAPDWSFGLVGWYLLLLLLDRVPLLLAAMSAHLATSVGVFLLAGTPNRGEISAAGTAALGAVSVQLAVVVFAKLLRHNANRAMAVSAERDRLVTRLLVAEQWERGQRTVFAGRLGMTLPLLADLADGVLDPRDGGTQRRCALAATQLRRLFAENDEVPDPLVHEVTACVDVAERRGIDVSLAISGAAVAMPPDVRHELTGPVAAVLSAARERARVSVLRTDEDVRIAVLTDGGADVVTASSGRIEVECGTYGKILRLEARWRRQPG